MLANNDFADFWKLYRKNASECVVWLEKKSASPEHNF